MDWISFEPQGNEKTRLESYCHRLRTPDRAQFSLSSISRRPGRAQQLSPHSPAFRTRAIALVSLHHCKQAPSYTSSPLLAGETDTLNPCKFSTTEYRFAQLSKNRAFL